MKCNLCGKCKQVCPVFRVTKLEKLSPRGKALLIKNKINSNAFLQCTLCRACKEICPQGYDLPKEIIKFRNKNI
jgi:glycolate oxidase iron-sulfur subunit